MFGKLHSLFINEPYYKELVDGEGYTLPFICAKRNDANAMKFLIKEGFNILEKIKNMTVFHTAAESGSMDVLKILLKHKPEGLNIIKSQNDQSTPLLVASQNDRTDIVEFLLQQDRVKVNGMVTGSQTDFCKTPLHNACSNNNVKMVSLLPDQSIDVNVRDVNKRNALHFACSKNNVQMVSLLLDHEFSDINAVDVHWYNPLHYACHNNNIKIVSMLLDCKSIDVNVKCGHNFPDKLTKDLTIKRMILNRRTVK